MSFWKILFGGGEKLIDKAHAEALVSMENGKKMFLKVMTALHLEVDQNTIDVIKQMDSEMNQQQVNIRRMVYEHLSVSKGKDLLASLVLLCVVIDTERIGDYVKNISELIKDFPGKLEFDEFEEIFERLNKKTIELFDLTKQAFEDNDEAKAKKVMEVYGKESPLCDITISKILSEKTEGGMVKISFLVLVLMLRHMKRVMAHLKNIASTVVNPFDRIGYRYKSHKRNIKSTS